MPLIWSSISAHGFGHAAQVVPVLNELGRRLPELRVILRTQVPASFFESRLTVPWQLSPAQQDVGCIQDGPLKINVPATWAAHRAFHSDWDARVQGEAQQMRQAGADLVLSDISHLGIAAGAASGLPTIGLSSLSWDLILEPYLEQAGPGDTTLLRQIREAYGTANLFLQLQPGLTTKAFRRVVPIGPVAEPAEPRRTDIRAAIQAANDEVVVLVGFGGIPLTGLPFEQMEAMTPYRFVVDGAVPERSHRSRSLASVGMPFKTALASVDLIMTKPGYGTIVEAVALGKPVVYVRRYNFADEPSLVNYLHRYGRGAELSPNDFARAYWPHRLDAALTSPQPPSPLPALTGSVDAARELLRYL